VSGGVGGVVTCVGDAKGGATDGAIGGDAKGGATGGVVGVDPWPHSGFDPLPDMCQSFQAGWLFSDLREKLADRVFAPLYGTRELHSSKEGFTFHRPTADVEAERRVDRRKPFVCGIRSTTQGEHFDQRAADTGLHCIQR
jgi:hypothetical protein